MSAKMRSLSGREEALSGKKDVAVKSGVPQSAFLRASHCCFWTPIQCDEVIRFSSCPVFFFLIAQLERGRNLMRGSCW
jgi:hypothetical protein